MSGVYRPRFPWTGLEQSTGTIWYASAVISRDSGPERYPSSTVYRQADGGFALLIRDAAVRVESACI